MPPDIAPRLAEAGDPLDHFAIAPPDTGTVPTTREEIDEFLGSFRPVNLPHNLAGAHREFFARAGVVRE